jgi:hypothetical protein
MKHYLMHVRLGMIGCLIGLSMGAFAQYPWEGVFMPGTYHGAERRLFTDQENGTVYATGHIHLDNTSYEHSAVLAWRNNQWDTVLYDVGYIKHTVVHHDTLFIAGGGITTINGQEMANLVYHHNGEWHSLQVNPSDPAVNRFRIIEDTLYACVNGGFGPVYRLVNSAWERFGISVSGVWGLDIIKYDGEFYGSMNGAPGGHVVSKLVNGQWVGFSDSLIANISMAGTLVEYQGDLYVGGQLSMNEGLPGQGIFRYDGGSFHPLGVGLQTYLTNNNGWCGVQDMVVNDGLLFVTTSCNYVGGAPVNGMAIWDGSNWCAMPGDPQESGSIMSIAFFLDTLYLTCGATIDGEPVGFMARFIGPSYTEDCELFASLADVDGSEGRLHIGPNPASGLVNIQWDPGLPLVQRIMITDALGREVWQQTGSVRHVDVQQWPAGLYHLRAVWSDGRMEHLPFVVE